MRLSVIVSNYNYAKFLPMALESLFSQTEAIDEIIVVDDGSTDHSRAILDSYGDKIITVYQDNSGQAAAINNGFSRGTGDIICLMDADDVFFPDKIKILKKVYAEHLNAGWVFHALKLMTPEETSSRENYPEFSDAAVREIDERANMKSGHLLYDAPATSGLTFRRDFIKELFPLPTAQSIYLSDHYIKFYAQGMGKGLMISETLGGQVVHGENLYTGAKTGKLATRAKIFANTAYYLREKIPHIRIFCTNLMCEAVLCARKSKTEDAIEGIADQYFSALPFGEKIKADLKIAVKSLLAKLK